MQGEGLLVLSGERQRQLQEQITATKVSSLALTRENGELQKQVCVHSILFPRLYCVRPGNEVICTANLAVSYVMENIYFV